MRKEVLIRHTITEVVNLRNHLQIKELNRLNTRLFNPFTIYNCIYGLSTGSCESIRTQILMTNCAVVEIKMPTAPVQFIPSAKFIEVNNELFVSRKYTGATWAGKQTEKRIERSYMYLTALEVYIRIRGANISNIISYLQDKTDELLINKIY